MIIRSLVLLTVLSFCIGKLQNEALLLAHFAFPDTVRQLLTLIPGAQAHFPEAESGEFRADA